MSFFCCKSDVKKNRSITVEPNKSLDKKKSMSVIRQLSETTKDNISTLPTSAEMLKKLTQTPRYTSDSRCNYSSRNRYNSFFSENQPNIHRRNISYDYSSHNRRGSYSEGNCSDHVSCNHRRSSSSEGNCRRLSSSEGNCRHCDCRHSSNSVSHSLDYCKHDKKNSISSERGSLSPKNINDSPSKPSSDNKQIEQGLI